jgi:hypothetical protein
MGFLRRQKVVKCPTPEEARRFGLALVRLLARQTSRPTLRNLRVS